MSDIQELESEARANASNIRLIRRVLEMCKAKELTSVTVWGDGGEALRPVCTVLTRSGYIRYSTRAHRYMLTDEGKRLACGSRRHRGAIEALVGRD